jgi:hypothetical protein
MINMTPRVEGKSVTAHIREEEDRIDPIEPLAGGVTAKDILC